MKLKHLESALSVVRPFQDPQVAWEQYPTSAHLASRMIYLAESNYDDIDMRVVADLGTGTGMLGLAAKLMGSSHCVGFDIDPTALTIAQENAGRVHQEMDFVQCDVSRLPLMSNIMEVDTVVTNPPFGTRNKGIDVAFVEAGLKMCTTAVYSLHKTSTREYLTKKAEDLGAEVEVLAQMRFDLPKSYKFHKKKSVDIEVDLLRFAKVE